MKRLSCVAFSADQRSECPRLMAMDSVNPEIRAWYQALMQPTIPRFVLRRSRAYWAIRLKSMRQYVASLRLPTG